MKILRYSLLVLTVCLLWLSIPASAQTTMTTIINSKFSAPIQLIPVDAAHQSALPASLVRLQDRIPPGSVLLVNNSAKPIITVVTDWSFKAPATKPDHKRINCDGFLSTPPQEIVHAHSMTLITSNGCTSNDVFPMLGSDRLFGSSLDKPDAPAPTRAALDQVDDEAELATARELVARRLPTLRGVAHDKQMSRLVGMLARKGYSSGVAFRIMRDALDEAGTA